MEPINYMAMTPQINPLQSLAQGLQAGAILAETREKTIKLQQANDLARQYSSDLQTAFKNPTPESLAMLSSKYPQQREAFKQSWDMLSDSQKNHEFSQGLQAYNAIMSGDIDSAKNIINKNIEATKNSGGDSSFLESIRTGLDSNPTTVAATAGMYLSSVDPVKWKQVQEAYQTEKLLPEKLAQEALKTQKEGYLTAQEQTKAEFAEGQASADLKEKLSRIGLNQANIKNVQNQIYIRGQQLGLDRQKTAAYVGQVLSNIGNQYKQMPSDVRKGVNDAAINASDASQNAKKWADLHDKFNTLWTSAGRTGLTGKGIDILRNAAGSQDDYMMLKKQYTGMIMGGIKAYLPQGPASDQDVKNALAGFPDANTDPRQIASFARGMEKNNLVKEAVETAKADWLSQNGTLGRTKTGFQAGSYMAKPNQSFPEFAKTVAQSVINKYNKEHTEQLHNVNPIAPVVPSKKAKNVMNMADKIIGL